MLKLPPFLSHMENVEEPLKYFISLFSRDNYNERKSNFVSNIIEQQGYEVVEYDYEKGEVSFWGHISDQSEGLVEVIQTEIFKDYFVSEIESEIGSAIESLEKQILLITAAGISPEQFINLQILTLKEILEKSALFFLEAPAAKRSIVTLIKYIHEKYLTERILSIDHNNPDAIEIDDYCNLSFNWDSLNSEEKIPNIQKLYSLLIESPALIHSSAEDFVNAFTMRKVSSGIRWLQTGKNGLISKSSLFYFISRLIEDNVLTETSTTNLNKKIEYLFRDAHGNTLKNIKQSKSITSTSPTGKDRIDSVMDALFT